MKLLFAFLVTSLLLITTINVHADPAEDRSILLEHYKKTLPDIKFEDYVYGALSLNPESKAMSFYNVREELSDLLQDRHEH